MKRAGKAKISTGAFELVWRIAGPPIELPPRSNMNASGKASSAARMTEATPETQPMVRTR